VGGGGGQAEIPVGNASGSSGGAGSLANTGTPTATLLWVAALSLGTGGLFLMVGRRRPRVAEQA